MGGGGGQQPSSGRSLTPQELQLIEAQTRAFGADQQRQAGIYGAASTAAQRALQTNQILGQQISDTTRQIGAINQRAFQEGTTRRAEEEGILRAQLGIPGALQQLAGRIQNPENATTAAGGRNIAAVGSQALAGAQSNPLLGYANELRMLGGQNYVNSQIAALNRSGTGIIPQSQQARALSALGQNAGAAELALTPDAIRTLEQVQAGQVPTAVSRLFSGTDTAARAQTENQFNAARQRLIESGVTGGALTRALAGLEGQRAMGIAGQVEARENEARNFSANLLNQATTYGLNQPFQRQQLQLQGLQAGGNLALGESQMRNQALQASGQMGLAQAQLRGDLGQAAAQTAAQNAQLRQGYLGLAGQSAQAQANLGMQLFQGNLAANQARQQALLGSAGLSMDLAGRLGAGGDALAYQTAPALATQLVQMRQLGSQAQAIPIDILRGGTSGSGVDLSGALAAAGNAANFQGQQQPSRGQRALGGAMSGAATGATVGAMFGPVGLGIGAAAGGLMGLASGFL